MAADETVQAYLDAFNDSDIDAIAALYAASTTYRNPFNPQPVTSPAEVREFEAPMFAAFSAVRASLEETISDGSRAAVRVVVHAEHTGELQTPAGPVPATGKSVELHTAEFFRVDAAGLIVEHHRFFDVAAFMGQLGLT
jgi:steroid delta-isomerase-like uncharacterized protein